MNSFGLSYCEKKRYLLGVNDDLVTNMNKYLTSVELKSYSLRTIRTYAFCLIALFKWLKITQKKFEALTQSDLMEFILFQKQNNSATQTINQRLVVTQVFYRFCFNHSIPNSGFAHVGGGYYKGPGKERDLGLNNRKHSNERLLKIKQERKLIEPLTPAEINSFFRTLARYRDISIVHLMLFCGLRSLEILLMQMGDIDFFREQIKVRGKGKKERLLPLPSELKAYLGKYIEIERPKNAKGNSLFLILQGKGRGLPMTTSGLRNLFRYRRKCTGIENANAHCWRHTFGSNMARSNVRLPTLQKMMGHESAETTLRYIHLSTEDIAVEFKKALENIKKRYEKT